MLLEGHNWHCIILKYESGKILIVDILTVFREIVVANRIIFQLCTTNLYLHKVMLKGGIYLDCDYFALLHHCGTTRQKQWNKYVIFVIRQNFQEVLINHQMKTSTDVAIASMNQNKH